MSTTHPTIGQEIDAVEGRLAEATAAHDWTAVKKHAQRLTHLGNLADRFSPDALYEQALIGHRVVRSGR